MRQFFCGLTGHNTLPQFEPNRMYLKCVDCGHETPGFAIETKKPLDK